MSIENVVKTAITWHRNKTAIYPEDIINLLLVNDVVTEYTIRELLKTPRQQLEQFPEGKLAKIENELRQG